MPRAFGELPMELALYVLDLAAASSIDSALAISLVSAQTRKLVLRYLFCTLTIPFRSARHKVACLSTLPYIRHLRHLWLESDIPFEEDPHTIMLHLQTTVTHLALPPSFLTTILSMAACIWTSAPGANDDSDGRRASAFPCRELTILLDDLSRPHAHAWGFSARTPTPQGLFFLRGITHLHLFTRSDLFLVPLDHLLSLSHIAVPVDYHELWSKQGAESRTIARLTAHERFRMIVIVLQSKGRDVQMMDRTGLHQVIHAARRRDDRLYVVEGSNTKGAVIREWKEAARGAGETLWERASRLRIDYERERATLIDA